MIEIRDFFSAKEQSIKSLFTDGNRSFKIPDYQRNFAWTEAEVKQLWEDFKATYEKAFYPNFTQRMHPKPHFFGTILLTESTDGANVFEITDGQQRLTMSTLFLKALLEISDRLETPNERTGIASLITPILQRNDYDEPFEQRLFIDDTINDLYKQYVLLAKGSEEREEFLRTNPIRSQNPPSSAQKLKEAYDLILYNLSLDFPEGITQVDLHEKLTCYIKTFNRLFTLLEIRVKNRETAYTIFGTINNRGKDLTDSDIIKNEIFKSVPESQRYSIKEKWDNIIESIDTEDLTDYLRFQYASIYGPVKKVDLFSKITSLIGAEGVNGSIDPMTYLDQLKLEADWYAKVRLIGTTDWNEEITSKLEAFKVLDISHSIPLLLTGAILYNDNEQNFEKLVNATLVFCFRYFTIGKNSVENLEREVGNMSKALREGARDLDSTIHHMQSITSDQEFSTDFSTYSTKSSNIAFYILNQLETQRMTGVVPLPHGPSQHIEHIMPKKPSQAQNRLTEWNSVRHNPEYKDFVYRLGNLIILESEINQRVGNKEFTDKKVLYDGSGLSYPREISTNFSTWDFTTINARQRILTSEALTVWRYY